MLREGLHVRRVCIRLGNGRDRHTAVERRASIPVLGIAKRKEVRGGARFKR